MRKLIFLKMFAVGIFILGLLTFLIMYLWNWLMPELFHLPTITYWQALGLFALCKILFGFHKGGRNHQPGPPWQKLKRKWNDLPEDRRARWKQQFQKKWCEMHGSPFEDPTSPPDNPQEKSV